MNPLELKVLSYNIHKGVGTNRFNSILGRVRDALHEMQPDIVFLQEVLGHPQAEHAVSQFEYLAEELWPHFSYGKNVVHGDGKGHHGNAVLSRFPIVRAENIDVSSNPFEKRGLLHAVIELPDHPVPLHAICIHLALFENGRERQVARLCERINEAVPRSEPLIVAGDFNDWRERVSPVLESAVSLREVFIDAHGRHPKTFPSWLPMFAVDRIYCRGLRVKQAICLSHSPWRNLSDHAAVYSELVI